MKAGRVVLVVATLLALSGCPLESPARLLGGACESDQDCASHLGATCVALQEGGKACVPRGEGGAAVLDSGALVDAADATDSGPLDAGRTLDAGLLVDASEPADASAPLDAGLSVDAAALRDAGDGPDAALADAGEGDASFADGGGGDAGLVDGGPDAGPPPCPGAPPTGPFCDDSDSALALCFDFETTSAGGSVVQDGSAHDRDGTLQSGAALVAGHSGKALQPNDGYLRVGNFDFGADFTLEAWLYLAAYTTTADRTMIADNNGDWGFSVTAGGALRCTWNVVATTVDGVFPTGRWTHAACRQQAGFVSLYLDGELVATSPTAGTRESPVADDIFVGANSTPGDDNWSGRIDDVRFWTSARDPALLCWDAQAAEPP